MALGKNKKIILASASADRKKLLDNLGINFQVIESGFEEDHTNKVTSYEKLILELAKGKCQTVLKKIESLNQFSNLKKSQYIIIAADTMVKFENEIIGKPEDQQDAFNILKRLAGKIHFLLTGVVIYDSESKEFTEIFDSTEVQFSDLTDGDIESYLENSEEYKNRAGAYSMRERASLFIKKINGSPSNVIGLPMDKIFTILKKLGVNFLENVS